MSEQLKESLSAAVDGEADDFELRRVLDETAKNQALRNTWERYHLVSAVLADQVTDASLASQSTLKNRVWEALDYEGASLAVGEVFADDDSTARTGVPPWLGRAVGFAVALGVAVLVVVGSGVTEDGADGGQVATLEVPETSPTVAVSATVTEEDLRRNDAYIMHHVQHTALNSSGMLPFVKMVTYEKAETAE